MGIHLQLVNYDELFGLNRQTPIIVNDLSIVTEQDRAAYNKLVRTTYNNDVLSNMPTCECSALKGTFNLGRVCDKCRTVVTTILDENLEPVIWMRRPNGVAPLISPIVLNMLTDNFSPSGFDIIQWICYPSYESNSRQPLFLSKFQALGIPRGYNSFVENFDLIIEFLFTQKDMRTKADPLYKFIQTYRDCIFSDHIPLPNRALLVVENTPLGAYIDPIVSGAINAITTIVGIDTLMTNLSQRKRENMTIKTIMGLSAYYDGLYRNMIAPKEGIFRKHIFGTRCQFSFRAVISSETGVHNYDEIKIAWGLAVAVFGTHLRGMLMRRGFTVNKAVGLLNAHAETYHPLIHELLKKLLADSNGKIPCVLQRNPSLCRASAQLMYIVDFLMPGEGSVIVLSILSVKGYNADKIVRCKS